ncbi:MAG: arylesterase [Chthoniobacterales bacterium]
MGKLNLRVIALAAALVASSALAQSGRTIVFLGDSLSAGFGVQPNEAFPALIAEKLRTEHLPYEVENAGVSGDTTAGGLRRVDWLLQKKIDVLVLELGANDGLRGLSTDAMKSNLEAIIKKVRAKNPEVKVVIAGMQMPPNLGGDYSAGFRRVYQEVAAETNAVLIPFLLDGVGGVRDLNQPDMIHPTAAGHRLVAENVWRVLEPLLRDKAT